MFAFYKTRAWEGDVWLKASQIRLRDFLRRKVSQRVRIQPGTASRGPMLFDQILLF